MKWFLCAALIILSACKEDPPVVSSALTPGGPLVWDTLTTGWVAWGDSITPIFEAKWWSNSLDIRDYDSLRTSVWVSPDTVVLDGEVAFHLGVFVNGYNFAYTLSDSPRAVTHYRTTTVRLPGWESGRGGIHQLSGRATYYGLVFEGGRRE